MSDYYITHYDRVEKHYRHAREKHPYFCDYLTAKWMGKLQRAEIDSHLIRLRRALKEWSESGDLMWDTLLDCEVWEVHDAIERGDKAQAVEECFDAIAVLLRVVDVLEGRQALGKPGALAHNETAQTVHNADSAQQEGDK